MPTSLCHNGIPVTGDCAMGRWMPMLWVGLALLMIWPGVAMLVNYPVAAARLAQGAQLDCETAWRCAQELSRPVIPFPAQLWSGLVNLSWPLNSSTLPYNALYTAAETLAGLGLALLVGAVTGTVLAFSRAFERMVLPWLVASQNVPIIALAPVIAVLLGQFGVEGLLPKAIVSAYIAFFPLSIGIARGLQRVHPLQLDLMRTYASRSWQVFLWLRIPAALPMIFTSLKLSVTMALVGAMIAEISIVSFAGLGPMILGRLQFSDTTGLWAIMIYAAGIGILMVQGIQLLERLVLRGRP
ncbi:MAG: ABC transporter permease subunit [Thermostichales cyanobacterium DRC_bins_46]